MKKTFIHSAILLVSFLQFSCTKDKNFNPLPPPKVTADAGPAQTIILPVNTVTLTGTGTTTDGNIVAYQWTKYSGPAATIVSPDQAQTQVVGLEKGVYQFELKVTNNKGVTGNSFVQVTVTPTADLIALDSKWFSIDTTFSYIEYDSTYFFSATEISRTSEMDLNDNVAVLFTKKTNAGVVEYKRQLNPMEISIILPAETTPFVFHFGRDLQGYYADGINGYFGIEFLLESENSYSNTYTGKVAFMKAVEQLMAYEYRCLLISRSNFNSLSIDWNNYLGVVAALGITP